MDKSSFVLGLLGDIFHFYSNFNRTICKQNSGDPDQTPSSGATDLSLHCLLLSHKNEVRLIWDKTSISHWNWYIINVS